MLTTPLNSNPDHTCPKSITLKQKLERLAKRFGPRGEISERDADEAEVAIQLIRKRKTEFEKLFDNIAQGLYKDDPCPKADTCSEEADVPKDCLKTALTKLVDLENEILEVFGKTKKDGEKQGVDQATLDINKVVRYLSLPGKIPSEILDVMCWDITSKIKNFSVRETRFIHMRRFQGKSFTMRVYGTQCLPHQMILADGIDNAKNEFGIMTRAFSDEKISQISQEKDKEAWEKLAPENIPWAAKILGAGMVEIKVQWCAATHLMGCGPPGEETSGTLATKLACSQIEILRAVVNSNGDPCPLSTVLGRAIVYRAWQEVVTVMTILNFADAIGLLLFFLIVKDFRNLVDQGENHGNDAPDFDARNQIKLLMLAAFSFYTIVAKIVEIYQSMRVFGPLAGLWVYFTFWNSIFFGVEVFNSMIVLIPIVVISFTEHATVSMFLHEHPVFFALSVFFRWAHFLMSLLSLESLGQTVLPAFHAATSYDSVMFVTFLTFAVLGATHSYWVLPIPDNLKYFDTFIKIFRLSALGDFDMNDLEGLNQVITPQKDNYGNSVKMLMDPEPDTQDTGPYHYGVRYLFVILSIVFSIMMMNVYIGLLSTEYDRAKKNSKAVLLKFRARLVIPIMLRRIFYMSIFGCKNCESQEVRDPVRGFWITMPQGEMVEQKDD
eukprot:TRINITY_DN25628_c0_g2_i1.p1 TRINITY_DN25628_c0_g2~~TRINITY_DN25628_c0_g2_i1.p1  ORF type:complete len:665 (-),score=115.15 TRINITY_DN25628_c0_g2_i1:91-2085(-)